MSDSVQLRELCPPQAPLSLGFFRQEYWSGFPFPSPGDLPDLGIEPASLKSLVLAEGFFTTSTTWKALSCALMASEAHLLHCHLHLCCCCSVGKSCPTLPPYKLQHTRLLCPSLFLGVCSNSCPLSQWCPTISSSVSPFSSCPQSFPTSGSFPVSQLFASKYWSFSFSICPPSDYSVFRVDFLWDWLIWSPCCPRDSQ